MKFEWDERKNHANVEKHGLDFADAHKVFKAPMLVKLDEREDYGEYRWIGIGLMDMRDERKRYEQAYKDEFGTL
jgi:uncharacterized DUF497 family protein